MASEQEELADLREVAAAMAAYVPEPLPDNPSIERCQFCKATWRHYTNAEGRQRVESDGHRDACPVIKARKWQ